MIFHIHQPDGKIVRSTTRPTSVDKLIDGLPQGVEITWYVTCQPTQTNEYADDFPIFGHQWDSAHWRRQLSRWSMERRNQRRHATYPQT